MSVANPTAREHGGRATDDKRLTPLGVYVHFPWCLKKCPYCDFWSLPRERQELPHEAYADAVIAELEWRVEKLGRRELESVFFGGGTPSLWEPRALGRVLSAIRERFEVNGALEATVECNPSSFDRERARALLDAGVNRVSIGVQSLDAGRLAFLGRLHDASGGLRAVAEALAAGVPRVSADLIFGVHGQTPEEAAGEARRLAELGPSHVSAYALTVEPGTEFGRRSRERSLPLCPDDAVAESFLAVDQALCALGYEHYEISNFAQPGARSRHNLGYWQGREYLGLGVGAWGTLVSGGVRERYRNTLSPERYLKGCRELAVPSRRSRRAGDGAPTNSLRWVGEAHIDLAHDGGLVCERERIENETALSERILLGLRLAEGLNLTQAAHDLGVQPWTKERRRAAERLSARGRLVCDGDVLRIPKSAWLFADGTISELM